MLRSLVAHLRSQRASTAVGQTLGVEEEYHLVDATTYAPLATEAGAALSGPTDRLCTEISTTQLETSTQVCHTLSDVRAELTAARVEAAEAAARIDGRIVAVGIHPFSTWRQQRLTPEPRYARIYERYGAGLALQQALCGCHVHVGMPDLDTAVAVMDRARPYLPVLLAMTGSSPLSEGLDTGYESYRTQSFARWPTAGPPDVVGDGQGFRHLVGQLQSSGVIKDASNLYWDVRPSVRYPTLEFRIADVCTTLDDAVLHAGVVRSLCRVLAARAATEAPVPSLRSEVLRAARWQAARHGLGGELMDPRTGGFTQAPAVVDSVLEELREDLEAHDEWAEVQALTTALLARGTSADQQRAWLRRGASLQDLTARLAAETTSGLRAVAADPMD